MKTLWNYINSINTYDYDAHIHLFDHENTIFDIYTPKTKYLIGFADIDLNDINKYNGKMLDLYKNYIDKYYNDNQILLATAMNVEEIISIYEAFPNIIKGFGELKMYNSYMGKDLPYKKISFLKKLCSYICKFNLSTPIYIHYSLTNDKDVQMIGNILKAYPNVKIVLCHCGMKKNNNNDFSYYSVINLMEKYSNLYVDISCVGLYYFSKNPYKITNLDTNRVLLGTDFNIKYFEHENDVTMKDEEIYNNILVLNKFVNSDHNVKKLFKA